MNSSDKYIKLNPREHVLLKPSMYLGDTCIRREDNYIFEDDKIIKKNINWSPALYKIFDEIIVNAYDQSIRDETLTFIKVKIDKKYIEIENDGVGIDIYIHPKHNIYIPELIFGNLLTSTNFSESEQRITGGTHGLGAKLTNIFSKKFEIEVIDAKRNLRYTQVFRDNLTTIEEPKIEKIDKEKGKFKIKFYPDFSKFKINHLDEDHIKLFKKRVYDLTGLTNKKIYLNGKKIGISGWGNYLKLYGDNFKIYSCNKYWKIGVKVEFNSFQVSFVNGIFTNKNGKHIEHIYDQLLNKYSKKLKDITKKWLKNSVTIILKASIINPNFNSQTKEELMTPISRFGIVCELDSKFYSLIDFKKLEDLYKKQSKILFSKTEGKKKTKIKGIPKLEDANFAGTKKSADCTLILTEGDSAKATAISGVSAVKNGRDIYGVFPLRGKLINVREASIKNINKNEEITNIKKILGLKSDIKYTKENLGILRYGSIMLMMDADEDGSHIKGLVMNFLYYFYPSLLTIEGFLKILVTPVVRATSKNDVLTFRNQSDYLVWRQKKDRSNYKIKYYKGLGTSTRKEAEEYFTNIRENIQNIISETEDIPHPELELAFGRKFAEKRKNWLKNYNINNKLKFNPDVTNTLKEFIHLEMKHFSNYDNIRSLPNYIDGFKPSQRKVIYACLKRNLTEEMKVAQLSGYVAETTSYHHGEASLTATIIKLAQNFIGSNNLNLLLPNGQFGTRLLGGKDHSSARYIYTQLSPIIKYIFRKEDEGILNYLDDDGSKIEPEVYYPIIPTILINGTDGIGTGFSTFVPNYCIKDIINVIEDLLEDKKYKKIHPCYENFKGNIVRLNSTTYLTKGKFNIQDNYLTITELPIKTWTTDYKAFLEDLVYEQNDPFFSSLNNQSSDREINFILKIRDNEKIKKMNSTNYKEGISLLEKHLKLYNYLNIGNMHMFNETLDIKLYSNVENIIKDFFKIRLQKYKERKDYLLKIMKEELQILKAKFIWIKNVLSNKIDLRKQNINDIINYLKKNNTPLKNNTYDYLLNTTIKDMSKDNLKKLEEKINNLKKNIDILIKRTPQNLWKKDIDELKYAINKY